MDNYLLAIGWWNLVGSFFMFSFFHLSFGRKVFNEWTQIFATPFELDYWSKFWMAWAIGLNIFFAVVNIYAVKWGYPEIKLFCIVFDFIAYSIFTSLAFWGLRAKRCGSGIYSVFVIFLFWIGWGIYVLI